MTLQDFLNQNTIEKLEKEVAISNRLKDENGELYKFRIKAMTSKEFEDIKKNCTKVRKKGVVEVDNSKLSTLIVLNSVIYPDFKDVESLNQLGCVTPEQYINKVLLAGEVQALVEEIRILSGFDSSITDLKEEVKN